MKTMKNTAGFVGRTLNYRLYGTRGYDNICYSLIAEEEGRIMKQTCEGVYYHCTFLRLSEKAVNDLREFGIYRSSFPGDHGMLRLELRLN